MCSQAVADECQHQAGPRATPRGHVREMLSLGLINLVLLGLFGRFVVPGVIGHQRDTGAFYYPLTAWFAQQLQAGSFPLWCPLIFGGYPLLADGEIGMLYPPNILALLAFPSDVAFVLMQAAHYGVAGLGTYALARVLGVGRAAAGYAGLAFALGAFMIGHLDHGNIVRSAAWLPGLLCSADLALRAQGHRTLGWIALAATTLALAGLGLHPQVLLIDLLALWSYLPMRALACGSRGVRARLVPVLSGTTLLGLAGAAVQLGPTYELGMLSSRGVGVPYAQATAGALSPFDLATLVLPYFFRAEPYSAWSLYPYWETTLYVGLVGTVLALVGLSLGRPRVVLPLAGLALVGLALGMAEYFPIDVYGWLWTLPGFSSMRMPGRYGLMIELPLAVLAGIGLDRLLADAGSRRARHVIAIVVAVALGVVLMLMRLRLWVEADQLGSLEAIRSVYLAFPHDRAALSAEQVRRGLLATLDLGHPWTLLAMATCSLTVALLSIWQRWPGSGRRWQGAMIAVATTELLLVAHAFHPTAPVGSLAEGSRVMGFLSGQGGLWRSFIVGRLDGAVTSRPALFGVAQPYGYSSLPTVRMERYWTRVNEVDDELLDLWNSRYVIEPKQPPGRISSSDILFDPARPLLDGPAESPLGREAFRLAPTHADAVRVLSATTGAAASPDGTTVAEIVVSGGASPPETLMVRLGEQTAESAYDADARPAPSHSRATVGYCWELRDPSGRVCPRNLYVTDIVLAEPRRIERIDVRTVAPAGQFRLAGLAVRDRSAGTTSSVLAFHREKYRPVYEDERTTIYENHAALPRALVVGQTVTVQPDEWALVHLLRRGFDPRRQVLLESPDANEGLPSSRSSLPRMVRVAHASESVPAQPSAAVDSATVEQYGTDRVVIRATSARGGHLVLTDSYYPGWRAWLDGQEVPIEQANYLFRAVALPSGEHLVEFRFWPTTVYLGGLVSLVTWVVIAGLATVGLRGCR